MRQLFSLICFCFVLWTCIPSVLLASLSTNPMCNPLGWIDRNPWEARTFLNVPWLHVFYTAWERRDVSEHIWALNLYEVVVSKVFKFHPDPWGFMIHIEEHIFRNGWFNHQLVFLCIYGQFSSYQLSFPWGFTRIPSHLKKNSPEGKLNIIRRFESPKIRDTANAELNKMMTKLSSVTFFNRGFCWMILGKK